MRQLNYRANLTSPDFPLLTDLQGATVIIPGVDQNYYKRDQDAAIPQIYYMHNIIPTDVGVCSVAYNEIIKPPLDSDGTFKDIYLMRDELENSIYLAVTMSGRNYILYDVNIGWVRIADKSPAAGAFVTTAHVNGVTYVCYGKVGTFKYNSTTKQLVEVTLKGLDKTKILGVCASSGYMIAWTATSVAWSSTIDPTDFTPSLATGAGGQSIQEAKAEIVCCVPQNGGFIVYTKRNAVSMSYSGNAQYPFTGNEIIGAGGLATPAHVAFDGNSTNHCAYTTAGLQEISMNSANIIHPQVTDFLAGSQFEDFDETTVTFIINNIATAMVKKISVIANRYLVISYGRDQLTHALYYDIGLGRWGKLKLQHVDCFEYFYPSSGVVDTPRKSIGFLQFDGSMKVSTLSYDTTGSYGVMICGKYQLDRNRYLDMQSITLESVKANNILNIRLLTSSDGKNINRITTPTPGIDRGTLRQFNCRAHGMNHSFLISGAFHAHGLELKFNDGGAVR